MSEHHRRRIQALGAAISRRDWSAVEQAHAEIRDAFDRPDIYNSSVSALAEGCCSALVPCPHQRQSPYTLCDACSKATD